VDVWAPGGSSTDAIDVSATYHAHRWRDVYRPIAALLRTCRQMHKEATPLFYGQPFRFSSDAGWIVLFYWLNQIGLRNRMHLKDITVCHPALSTWLDYSFDGGLEFFKSHLNLIEMPLGQEKILRFEEWMPAPMYRSRTDEGSYEFVDRPYYPEGELDFEDRWPGWQTIPQPAEMLATVKSLREVKLVANRRHLFHRSLDFGTVAQHPIYSYLKTRLPNTLLSVLEFVHVYDLDRLEQSERFEVPWTTDDDIEKQGTESLAEVPAQGWVVTRTVYDRYHNYPTVDRCPCINKVQCAMIHEEGYCLNTSCWHQWGYELEGRDVATSQRQCQRV
jgi:hypothetical protein